MQLAAAAAAAAVGDVAVVVDDGGSLDLVQDTPLHYQIVADSVGKYQL